MLRNFLFIAFLLPALMSLAQADTLNRFFHHNSEIIVDKFEREHLPLNGWEVTMLPFRVDERFGFVANDEQREWLIKPSFDQVFAVYREGAIVKKGKGYGLVSPENKTLIPFGYENLTKENGIYHGISIGVHRELPVEASVYLANDYFTPEGKRLFSETAHDQQSFTGDDTLAWFRYGSRYHIRSRSGRLIRSFLHDEKRVFVDICDDLLLFSELKNDSLTYTAYDIYDQQQFSFTFTSEDIFEGIYKLSDDLYGLAAGDANYYFCNAEGVPRLYGVFSGAVGLFLSDPDFFKAEYFPVMDPETRKMGVMSRMGELVIPLEYAFVGEYVNGLCLGVIEDGREFMLDQAGKKVLDVTAFSNMKSQEHSLQLLNEPIGFYEELCLGLDYAQLHGVDQQGKPRTYVQEDSMNFFYYDQTGTVRLKLGTNIQFAGNFSEGLAPAMNTAGGMGFIDTKGAWVVPPKYELAVAGGYPIPYLVVPEFIGGFAYIKSFKGYVDRTGRPLFSGKRMQDEYDFSH